MLMGFPWQVSHILQTVPIIPFLLTSTPTLLFSNDPECHGPLHFVFPPLDLQCNHTCKASFATDRHTQIVQGCEPGHRWELLFCSRDEHRWDSHVTPSLESEVPVCAVSCSLPKLLRDFTEREQWLSHAVEGAQHPLFKIRGM